MAWKNLPQTTLVDAMLNVHEDLKELDDVPELIDGSRIESLLAGSQSEALKSGSSSALTGIAL